MQRITSRAFLLATLILSICVGVFAAKGILEGQKEAWATLAALLAVVTSMISAWGAQRVVELEEEKLAPHPYPQFDSSSRYGFLLLKVTNFGGGTAHNIKLEWDRPLMNSRGNEVRFQSSPDADISVLVPGQHISKIVDGHIQFFQIEGPHQYQGKIHFEDANGRKRRTRFTLDAESLKGTPSYDDEGLKTHYELQKLPGVITKLSDRVDDLVKSVNRLSPDDDQII